MEERLLKAIVTSCDGAQIGQRDSRAYDVKLWLHCEPAFNPLLFVVTIAAYIFPQLAEFYSLLQIFCGATETMIGHVMP